MQYRDSSLFEVAVVKELSVVAGWLQQDKGLRSRDLTHRHHCAAPCHSSVTISVYPYW